MNRTNILRGLLLCAGLLSFGACVAETKSTDDASSECVPSCVERECGDDGCGGQCAPGCDEGFLCDAGSCVRTCTETCTSRGCECGEVCGQSCGACEQGSCDGCHCECTPDCSGKVCGDDGCGGVCEPGCGEEQRCVEGQCLAECSLSCEELRCDCDSVCGVSCGSCAEGWNCVDCQCLCQPDCEGRHCGDDGCGGSCGPDCEEGERCVEGVCVEECSESCGSLGCDCGEVCGVSCGICPQTAPCDGCHCVPLCAPDCSGRVCGDDGCGGHCMPGCGEGQVCDETGQCLSSCEDSCAALGCDCGTVCGESCGSCVSGVCDGCHCVQEGELIRIPASGDSTVFAMGCPPTDGWCDSNTQPVHNVTLSAFELDRYEVTAAQYQACVLAGVCSPAGSGSSATYGVVGKENHPINEVTWHQAEAYCQWRGMRLPTEAEWERAAKGTAHRRFPWGDACPVIFDANYCVDSNWDQSPAKANCSEARCFDLFAQTAPVGSFADGVSPEGVHDLAGNVFEWVADWYDPGYYSASPAADPAGPSTGSYRVARGGSWNNYGSALRSTVRNNYAPSHAASNLGFRCAR